MADSSIVSPRIKRGVSTVNNKPNPPHGSKQAKAVKEQKAAKAKRRRM